MTEEENKWQLVEKYLEGGMAPSEREAFETAMANDPLLSAMVEASQLATEVVIGHESLKLKKQMAKDLAKPKPNLTFYLLLPLVLAGVGIGAYFYSHSEKETEEASALKEIVLPKEQAPPLPPSVSQTEKPTAKATAKEKTQKPSPIEKEESLPVSEVKTASTTPSLPRETLPLPTASVKEEAAHVATPTRETIKDPCEGLKIELQFLTQPTCAHRHTGEVRINTETVKGGTPPYSFSFYPDKEFVSHEIQNLKEGTYTLYVKDAHPCTVAYAKPIVVHKITCVAPKEYSYNPAFDAAWKIPYDEDKRAVYVKIINKGGQEVYTSPVQGGSPSEWNGESNTGSVIGLGYHTFLIEYSDGTVDKGAITILR